MLSARIRRAILALVSLAGCGEPGLECPATGAPLGLDAQRLEPRWGAGCSDPESWTADVAPGRPAWTIELRRSSNSAMTLLVSRMPDGVAAIFGTELILLGSDGIEQRSRELGVNVDWSGFATSEAGQMILASWLMAVQYQVLDPEGNPVWLRVLDVDSPAGNPMLTLDDDDSPWLAIPENDAEGMYRVRVQHWQTTGGLLSEVVLQSHYAEGFARDGTGRFAFITFDAIELFEPDGTAIAAISMSDLESTSRLLGLADGFVAGGELDRLPTITRIDGNGEIVWQRQLAGTVEDGSGLAGLAVSPGGGVVAVGREATIDPTLPGSPIDWRTQPFVLALDEEGEPIWGERLAVGGQAESVTVGSQGEIYVAGFAQAQMQEEVGDAEVIAWVRRYDP